MPLLDHTFKSFRLLVIAAGCGRNHPRLTGKNLFSSSTSGEATKIEE
jgi:hypothetical protein